MAQTNGHRAPRPQGLSQHCFALGMWGGNALLASVPCPLASVIQFHLPAPWEQEGQFQPPSSLWWRKMWIRGSLGVCLRIEEVARGRTRKRIKAARHNRTAVGQSPPRVACKAGRLLTPAGAPPSFGPFPTAALVGDGGRLVSLRLQSQGSALPPTHVQCRLPLPPPAVCDRLLLEDTRFQFSTGQDSVTGLDRTLAWIRPFGVRPWKSEAGGPRGTRVSAGSSADAPGPASPGFVLVLPALAGTPGSHSPALAPVGRAPPPPAHGQARVASLRPR